MRQPACCMPEFPEPDLLCNPGAAHQLHHWSLQNPCDSATALWKQRKEINVSAGHELSQPCFQPDAMNSVAQAKGQAYICSHLAARKVISASGAYTGSQGALAAACWPCMCPPAAMHRSGCSSACSWTGLEGVKGNNMLRKGLFALHGLIFFCQPCDLQAHTWSQGQITARSLACRSGPGWW